MKRLLLSLALLLCAPAFAADLYYCKCDTGAQSGCVAGSDAAAGTIGAPKATPTLSQVNNAAAGDRFLMCQGGSWSAWSMGVVKNLNVTCANPLVIDSYAAGWGGGGVKPWLRKTGDGSDAFIIGQYLDTAIHGGYTIRNLHLDGSSVNGRAFTLFYGARCVTASDNEINNFHFGVVSEGSTSYPVAEFRFLRNYVHHNSDIGILGDFEGLLVEDNNFSLNNENCTTLCAFSHAIYLGGHSSKRGIIRNNFFDRTSLSATTGKCEGGNLTVHGNWDDVVIENNLIYQDDSGDGCWGISITGGYDAGFGQEAFRRFTVRGNTIVNLGLAGIAIMSSADMVVENNVVIKTTAGGQYGIVVLTRTDTTDILSSNINIRNNTVYHTQQSLGMSGIRITEGSGHSVTNNVVALMGTSNSDNSCFEVRPLASYVAHDYNLCYLATGTIRHSQSYASLAAAQAAGFDTHSLVANPLFAATPTSGNNWSLAVQSGSPARNAGANSLKSRTTRDGFLRDNSPDIGAYEFGATARVPQSPTGAR